MRGSDVMKNNRGTTMVEVLVGFTLLMILLSSLSHIIKVSSELFFSAKDMLVRESTFNENIAKKDAVFTEIEDVELTFTIDESKTDELNTAETINIILEDAACKSYIDKNTNLKAYKIEHR